MGDDTSREGGLAMVGILLLETKFPQVVGDGGNPDIWPYPVVVEKAGGATPHQVVVMGLEGLLEPFVEVAKALVAKGRTASPRLAASLPSTSASWPSARACPWPPNNRDGWGVPQDYTEAASWFKLAFHQCGLRRVCHGPWPTIQEIKPEIYISDIRNVDYFTIQESA